MPPRRAPEPDEDDEPLPIPTEPNGAELTAKRKRQMQGREAAEALWKKILLNMSRHNGTN